MRHGRRLALDVGEARVGVAVCDPDGLIATPVESVPRNMPRYSPGDTPGDTPRDVHLSRIADLCDEWGVIEVVVGLPRGLSGAEGSAAQKARDYARGLARLVPHLRICLVDERLTTVAAHRDLRAAGRRSERHRAVVDQQAAVLILETALAVERSTGCPPGEQLESRKPRAPRRQT